MFCWHCGKQIPDTSSICVYCGMTVKDNQQENVNGYVQHDTEMTSTSADHIGSRRIFFVMFFSGLGSTLLGAIIMAGSKHVGVVLIMLGAVSLVAAIINSYVLLYQIWRFVINESRRNGLANSIDTPGEAVGFFLIPLYNLYWGFRAIGQFPKDFNALAQLKGNSKMMSESLGMTIPLLSLLYIISFIIAIIFKKLLPLSSMLISVAILILWLIFIGKATRLCKEMQG